ncbi:MAG: protein translocase SEC61 complex subunit gamma [Candidatus Thorarchaeota archaeon]
MGISQFVNDSKRILKLATKPSKKEMWMNTKVSILAMFLVGMLSYLIQVLMTIITGNWVGT